MGRSCSWRPCETPDGRRTPPSPRTSCRSSRPPASVVPWRSRRCSPREQRLGYDRFVAQGGDWGSAVANALGALGSPAVEVVHPATGSGRCRAPKTIGWALDDSPVGQAAWFCEKYEQWTRHDGDPEHTLSSDVRPAPARHLRDQPALCAGALPDPGPPRRAAAGRALGGPGASGDLRRRVARELRSCPRRAGRHLVLTQGRGLRGRGGGLRGERRDGDGGGGGAQPGPLVHSCPRQRAAVAGGVQRGLVVGPARGQRGGSYHP